MAGSFSFFGNNDINTVQQKLEETVLLSSSVIRSSSYADTNIKTFSHGRFVQVYDYPYLSSSANYIFNVMQCFKSSSISSLATAWGTTGYDTDVKTKNFDQMSMLCFGLDTTGSIIDLNVSGSSVPVSADKYVHAYVLDFSRLVSKDGIKKGSFRLSLSSQTAYAWTDSSEIIYRDFASDSGGFKTNSPLGEYAILYSGSATSGNERGLIFYRQGFVVLNGAKIFSVTGSTGDMAAAWQFYSSSAGGALAYSSSILTQSANQVCKNLKDRIRYCSFTASTNLYSTVYTCRLDSQKFLHSTNPTFISSSGLIKTMKAAATGESVPGSSPTTFVTTIGLYSNQNELLAVAKLSEPFRVDEQHSAGVAFAVRLDF